MQVIIDGDQYIKQSELKTYSVGIGITTHNRHRLMASTLATIKAHTPNAMIVVVDDASDIEFITDVDGVVVYRFRRNVGIARAKNKCIELLASCDHVFLFDDDCYPIVDGWTEPYINSREHHLMYLFKDWASGVPVGDDDIIYRDADIVAHSHARGCMIYIDRTVIQTVGGMDIRYGKAMNEHLDYSNRIYNAGLTSFRYMDVVGSAALIHSMDEYREVGSSISKPERMMGVQNSRQLLIDSETSTRYAPFGKDVVIACYFANVADAQRDNQAWFADPKQVAKLKQSLEYNGVEFVLIHNCFDLPNKVTVSTTPYFDRWLKEYQYLLDHPEINNVFVVDATDVDMIVNPFNSMQDGVLYVGDEPSTTGNAWMLSRHQEPGVNKWLRENPDLELLNCGVVGGSRQMVMDLCRDMYRYHFEHPQDATEMGIFNKLLYSKYLDRFEHGRRVTTVFKAFERNTNAWFRHK